MNDFVGTARQWWEGRTARERRMLLIMTGLLTAVLVWFLVVSPALAWRERAAERRASAQADLTAVQADLRTLSASSGQGGAQTADAQGLEPIVRQSAEAAGLELTLGMDASGRLGFRIPSVSSGALFGWLAGLKTTNGIEVSSLGVTENADATLQVEGAF
ncbi:hypothetical protein GCM10009422_15320 [Brevundimonas kwangchunensis]|uniref:General secretion pathway protein GspM n=1 Tax=Brevundimonas kwangchunensis TaxID=322163 RepID=A0ABN1GVJ3_9CAUL